MSGEGCAEGGDEILGCPYLGATQERLDLAPHLFNGVEVRGVGGKEDGLGTCGGDEGERRLAFVRGEVVHDDQIAGPQRRVEHFGDVGAEDFRVRRPSMVMQAVVPSSRMEEIMVVVFQWPHGALAWQRSPRGARPRRRVMFGFTLALALASSIAFRGRRTVRSRRHQRPGWKAQSAAYS